MAAGITSVWGADYDFGKKNLLSVVYNTQYRYGQDCTKMRGTAHSDKTDDAAASYIM